MAKARRNKSHRRSNSWRSPAIRPDTAVTVCAPAGRAVPARPPSAAALPAAKPRRARRSIGDAPSPPLAISSSTGPLEPHAECRKMVRRGPARWRLEGEALEEGLAWLQPAVANDPAYAPARINLDEVHRRLPARRRHPTSSRAWCHRQRPSYRLALPQPRATIAKTVRLLDLP